MGTGAHSLLMEAGMRQDPCRAGKQLCSLLGVLFLSAFRTSLEIPAESFLVL